MSLDHPRCREPFWREFRFVAKLTARRKVWRCADMPALRRQARAGDPSVLGDLRNETILMGRKAFERQCREDKMECRDTGKMPSNVRTFSPDILTLMTYSARNPIFSIQDGS
jgi:hypothetical protein